MNKSSVLSPSPNKFLVSSTDRRIKDFTVFVGNFPKTSTQKDLHDLFAGCGAIERVAILDPPQPRHEYTFGFVVFTRVESVLQAVRELHNWRIGSSRIRVEIAHDTMAAVIGAADSNYAARIYTVYVGPMPPQMTAAQLKAMFGKCGPVHSVNIAGTSADKYVFGFVTFHDKGSALKSIQRYNHLTMGDYKLGVSISRERSILAEEDIVELTTEVERCRSTSWEAELGEEALILWELRKSWGVYMGDKKGSAVCSTAAQWQDFVKELLAVAHKPLPLPVVEMPSPTDFLKINKDTMLKLIKEAQLTISETDNSSQDDHRHSPSCWSVVMTMPSTTASVPISGQPPLSRTEPYIAPSDIHVSLSTAAEMQSVTKPLPKLNSPVAVPREERCHTTAKAASTANDIVVPSQNEAEFLGDTLTAVKSLLTSNDTAATPCNEVKSLEIIQTESSAASDAQSADGEQSESAEPGELTNVNKRTCHSPGDSTASSIAEVASTEAAIICNTTEKVNISLTEDSDNDGEKLPEVSREQCGGPSSMEFSPKANRTVEPPAELFLMKLLADLEVLHTTHRSMDNSCDLAMGDVLSTQYVEAAHDVGTTQDVDITPDSQGTGDVHITPDSQGTGDVHITPDSQGTGDVHITPDSQGTGDVHITPDSQGTGDVHITPDSQGTGDVHIKSVIQTTDNVHITADIQTTDSVQIPSDIQTTDNVNITPDIQTTDNVDITADSQTTDSVQIPSDIQTTDDVQTTDNVDITPDIQTTDNFDITADIQTTDNVNITADIQTTDNVDIRSDIQTTGDVHVKSDVQPTGDVHITPDAEAAKDTRVSPSAETIPCVQTSAGVQTAAVVRTTDELQCTDDNQTSPTVQIAHDNQTSPAVQIARDDQTSPTVQITHDNQTSPTVQIARDNQTSPAVQITRDNQTSPTVQITRDNQTSPTVQIARDNQTSPTVQIARDNQITEECHTAADSPAKSVPDSPLGRFLSRMEAQTRCEGLALPPSLQHPVRGSHSSHPNVLLRHDACSDVYGVMPQWDGIFSQHADASRQAIGGGEVSPPVVVDDAADDSDGESVVNIGQRYHEQELEDDDSDDRSGRAYRDFFGESAGGREPSSDEGPAEPDTSKCSSISSSSTISAGLLNDSQEQQMPQLVPLGPEEREDECDFEIDDALSRILAEFPHQAELLRRTPEAVRLRTLLNEIAVLQSYDAGYAADVQGSWDSEREAGLMEAELQLQKEIELHSSREEEDDLLYEKELFTLQGNETAIHELQLETGGEKISAAVEIAEMHLQVMRLRLGDSDL